MLENIEQAIRAYLPEVLHMSLATSRADRPWVCEVHFAYDDDLNLYFRSLVSRRHSEEIAANDRVAGNIVRQHGADEKPRGVYFEGRAALLENVDERHVAYRCCRERFGFGPEIIADARRPDGHRFYRITVETFYVFDAVDSRPSKKYELPWRST